MNSSTSWQNIWCSFLFLFIQMNVLNCDIQESPGLQPQLPILYWRTYLLNSIFCVFVLDIFDQQCNYTSLDLKSPDFLEELEYSILHRFFMLMLFSTSNTQIQVPPPWNLPIFSSRTPNPKLPAYFHQSGAWNQLTACTLLPSRWAELWLRKNWRKRRSQDQWKVSSQTKLSSQADMWL